VGRALVNFLIERKASVLPIVRNSAHTVFKTCVTLDLSSQGVNIAKIVPGRPKAVVHLAAAVPHSTRYPDNEQTAQLTKTIDKNIAEAISCWGCPVVYMSTCGLYDRNSARLKSEYDDTVIRIASPYFAAKYEGERIFSKLSASTIFRLAAPIGRGLKRKVVLGKFLEAARAGKTISVWGSGRREQNFVDVRDVARAVLMALEKHVGGIINLAGVSPVTMLELAQTIVEVVGRGDIRVNERSDPLEHERVHYDIRRADEVLGWRPAIGLRDSLNWIREEPLSD